MTLTRWRNRIDEAGAEELLVQAIEAGKNLKTICPRELRVVSIDTTVQEKNGAHPTDSHLLEVARAKLAERAAEAGIKLRQSYSRTGPRLSRQAGRYAHAWQYKRMRRLIKRQRTIDRRLRRDTDREATPEQMAQLAETIHRARRLTEQKRKSKHKL